MEQEPRVFKLSEDGRLWRVVYPDIMGHKFITFDKEKVYDLFTDYPQAFSEEQLQIIAEEMPYWANFFAPKLEAYRRRQNETKQHEE